MADGALGIRLATHDEITTEQNANPTDMWYQKYLDLDEHMVVRAARRLWGPPVPSGSEREWLWRLWSEELGVLVYIAVGVLRPAAIFSDGMCPHEGDDDRLRDEVRRMLLDAVGP